MSKKLKIGKTEVVIYPEGGHCYTSLKTKNGHKNQVYDSSNFPEILTAVFIGRKKGKDGKWYEKYTLKSIPEELKEFYLRGKLGFVNLIEELDAISQILQGRAADVRKILYSRSINIEDVNEILGVVVDYKNKRIYQKNNPTKNINELANFGKRRRIHPFEAEVCSAINSELIKENQLESTAYYYSIKDLKVSEKRKEIVLLNIGYYLASRSVIVFSSRAFFCEGSVRDGYAVMGRYLFGSDGSERYGHLAVRPVFYLESNIQDEIVEEQQEEKELKVDKNEAKNKVEIKKENTLKEPQENKDLEILNKIKEQQKKLEDVKKDIVEQQEKLANAQKNIEEKQEKITVLEKNIAKQQEELKKEKEELQKIVNEVLELI